MARKKAVKKQVVENASAIAMCELRPTYVDGWYAHESGAIFSTRRKGLTKLTPTYSRGYARVALTANSKASVHRLVASAFIPNPKRLPYVNHRDGNPSNNCVDNLEWCTPKQNHAHAAANGLLGDKSIAVIAYKEDGSGWWFRSAVEAAKYGFNRAGVSEAVSGKRQTHKGYVWQKA